MRALFLIFEDMKGIIQDWKRNAEKREEHNLFYIRSLKFKDPDKVGRAAQMLHKEAFEKIDCLQCGNCCKAIRPVLEEEDVERIANLLNVSTEEIHRKCLERDEFGDLTVSTLPCPFLGDNNRCKIYPARPEDCRSFPHTNKKSFASRSHGHASNTIVCPAAYYVVERMKKMIR